MTVAAILFALPAGLVFMLVVVNMIAWPAIAPRPEGPAGAVSVIIPARNEAANIGPCLKHVVAQGEVVREVWVYDDQSTDGTRDQVAEWAARDPRVRIIAGSTLPPGWTGKNHACARAAAQAQAPWLLFLDADARLAPGAVNGLVAAADAHGATFLSAWPGLDLRGFWEQALMPMLNFCVFTLFPAPMAKRRRDEAFGLAHGACLLIDRRTYEAVGGHGAVRHEIFEDTLLARLWRREGHLSLGLDGQRVVRVRMYDSFAAIWRGFQKNAFLAFRNRHMFWLFVLFRAAVFTAPFVILAIGLATAQANWLWAVAPALVLAARAALALRFHYALWPIVLHPLAEVLLIALGLTAWWRCTSGTGVDWKGRRYGAEPGHE